jgi:hypothetical protein
LPTIITLLAGAGLVSALFGAAAYAYGYVLSPKGFRPLNIIALCCGVLSMVQMVIALQHPLNGRTNLMYAVGLGVFSIVAQALMALRGRVRGIRSSGPDRRAEAPAS